MTASGNPLYSSRLIGNGFCNKLYDPYYIQSLFDEMSVSYVKLHQIISLGFANQWRKKMIRHLNLKSGMQVYDLMTGTGETWPFILEKISFSGKLIGLDISPKMLKQAVIKKQTHYAHYDIEVIQADILTNHLPTQSADSIVIAFGLKLIAPECMGTLFREIHRLLKPGGQFVLIEVTQPQQPFFKHLSRFYLKQVVPVIDRLLRGYPPTHNLLSYYTENFSNGLFLQSTLDHPGLIVAKRSYLGGCLTEVYGTKV